MNNVNYYQTKLTNFCFTNNTLTYLFMYVLYRRLKTKKQCVECIPAFS